MFSADLRDVIIHYTHINCAQQKQKVKVVYDDARAHCICCARQFYITLRRLSLSSSLTF